MHIEVWQSPPRIGDQRWHWHIRSKGRTVADAESFPTKSNAVRAAKACVRAVCKCDAGDLEWTAAEKDGRTILRWA